MTNVFDQYVDVFGYFDFNAIDVKNDLLKNIHVEHTFFKVYLVYLFVFFECFTEIFGLDNKYTFVAVNSLSFAYIYFYILSFYCIVISFF